MPQIDFSKIHTGMSVSDLSGGNTAIHIENIDISNPSLLKVHKKPVEQYSGTEKITHFLHLTGATSSIPKMLFFGRDGNIYIAGEVTPFYEFFPAISRDVSIDDKPLFKAVFYVKGFIYFIAYRNTGSTISSALALYKYSINSSSLTFSSQIDIATTSSIFDEVTRTSHINMSIDAVIQYGAKVDVISLESGIYSAEKDPFGGVGAGIVYRGGYFNIYLTNGFVHWWNMDDILPTYSYQNQVLSLKAGLLGDFDVVITPQGLYQSNSQRITPLYKRYMSEYVGEKFNISSPLFGNIATREGLSCFIDNNDIAFFGSYTPGMENAYYRVQNDRKYDEFYTILGGEKGFYVSYKDSEGLYKVDLFDTDSLSGEKYQKGTYITNEFFSDGGFIEKKSKKLLVYGKNLGNENYIDIEYSIDGREFKEYGRVNKDALIMQNINEKFRKICFRVTLHNEAELHNLIFDYD